MEEIFWNDQPIQEVAHDRFAFSDYAEALSRVVLESSTPITVGLFGPWGAGKTSLMRLITSYLLDQRSSEHRKAHLVWFNAWQYDRDEGAIWRSLLLRVLEVLKELPLAEADARRIEDWQTQLYADVQRKERGSLEIDWPRLGKGALHLGLSLIPTPGTLVEILKILDGQMGTLENLTKAFQREEIEIYRRKLTLLEEFQQGFASLVKEYIVDRNGLLVVCVDDLDRCLPDRALEIFEAIKLFLDVPGCVFFLAADHERIERVVSARYGSQEQGSGQSYLEKLVQLPFYLPPLETAQVRRYLEALAPGLTSETRMVFAIGLTPNPRMLKRTLNIFNLLRHLAERRASGSIDPVLLAKIVVIQAQHRDLYHDLLDYPNLIQELEMQATRSGEIAPFSLVTGEEVTPLALKYTGRRPLMQMLRIRPYFAPLSPQQIRSYLHLTRSTGLEAVPEVSDHQRLWQDLLSGDLTRVRAAIGLLQQRQEAARYAQALTLLLTGERTATLRERLSAAWALGYLGDLRNFDETATIPGGEFRYGEKLHLMYLAGYRISKYLVTNAQYARFLQAHPDLPVPYVNQDWARPYNWDPDRRTYPEGKANFPVILITYDEAEAYCQWAGGRLPTEEEWERAARGDDGRTFPWGEAEEPQRANVRETGLGGVTPVGCFLEGISPYGLLDAAGNVWEWTASPYNTQEKVLRGGAWNFGLEAARTFVRERAQPGHRGHVGFRVLFPQR